MEELENRELEIRYKGLCSQLRVMKNKGAGSCDTSFREQNFMCVLGQMTTVEHRSSF